MDSVWKVHGSCVEAACNNTRVKLTDLVVYMHLFVISHICVYFNQIRNLCYSYMHLCVFAKQKATSKYVTLNVRHKH